MFVENNLNTRVLSFDVGLKNLSFCVVDFLNNEFAIKKWQTISLRGKNISDYTIDAISKLGNLQCGCIDYVLIEQQINRNTQMKVLSHVIQSYFLCGENIPTNRVLFVSPKTRLDVSSLQHGTVVQRVKQELFNDIHVTNFSRTDFKKISIAIAEKYLLREQHAYWYVFFNTHAKKDDYADSLVQAIAWFSSGSVLDTD